MANFSNYLENKIVNWLNGEALATITGSLYVALYSSPGVVQDNAATNLIGFTTPRVEVSSWTVTTATGSSDSSDASITNAAEIVMTSNSNVAATASHFAVYDAASSGNLLFHGALSSSVAIALSDNVKFAIGAITLTVQ
jgi:hypothetical protein